MFKKRKISTREITDLSRYISVLGRRGAKLYALINLLNQLMWRKSTRKNYTRRVESIFFLSRAQFSLIVLRIFPTYEDMRFRGIKKFLLAYENTTERTLRTIKRDSREFDERDSIVAYVFVSNCCRQQTFRIWFHVFVFFTLVQT